MTQATLPNGLSETPNRLRGWRGALLIAVLALTLNLAGNGRTSLWDRDEPRYAGCTREMRERGDWIYPTFNGEPRFHKPILIYWLMRGGFAIGGDNAFGARLVSALAGTATSLVVLVMGRRMFGSKVGFLASLMLTSAPIMVIESKLATTDATLTFFLVSAQFCLWELSRRASRTLAAAFWVLMALATLTKGPVGLALIACSGLVSWWWGGPISIWKRLHWRWGIPLFLFVAAPWYVAVGVITNGEFYRFALGKQIAERLVTQMEQHGGFPGYYLVASLVTFHPWSALVPAALLAAWSRRNTNPDFGFLLGWVVGPLILLEAVQTKLVHYYLPAYPACALLSAWLIHAVAQDEVNLRRWPLGRVAIGLLGGVGIGLTATFLAGALTLPSDLRPAFILLMLIVGAGSLWGLTFFQRTQPGRAVTGLAISWSLAMLVFAGLLLPAAEPYRTSRIVGERLAALSEEEKAVPILLGFQEPSIVYAMKRPAPMMRQWDRFYELLDRHDAVVTAILYPREMNEFAQHPDLALDVRETIAGFNFTKGQNQTLKLAVIRRKYGLKRPIEALARSQESVVK